MRKRRSTKHHVSRDSQVNQSRSTIVVVKLRVPFTEHTCLSGSVLGVVCDVIPEGVGFLCGCAITALSDSISLYTRTIRIINTFFFNPLKG